MSDTVELTYRIPEKTIGGLFINAFRTEDHRYTAKASEYPIDGESPVSDNIRLQPEELSLDGIIEAGVISDQEGAQSVLVSIFDELLSLRNNRTPISVTTGLKTYTDMYISDFSVPRNADNGGGLEFSMSLKKLNVVKLTETAISSGTLGGSEDDQKQAAGGVDKGRTSGEGGTSGDDEGGFLEKVQESVDSFVENFS